MPSSTAGTSRRSSRAIASAALAVLALPFLLLTSATSASAAAGAPFDPNTPQIFSSKSANQADPTALYRLAQTGGTYAFTQVGPDADLVYNALTFNNDDNYLYAISGDPLRSGVPTGSLLRIGAGGGYDVVGTSTFTDGALQINMGAYDPDASVYYAMSAQGTQLIAIDTTTGTQIGTPTTVTSTSVTIPSDGVVCGSDFTFAQDYLWSLGEASICRLDPSTGVLTSWATPTGAGSPSNPAPGNDQAGSAWTFLGGDLGFSYNGSGQVVRIALADASSANPTFTTVSSLPGAASGQNDGAAIPGTVDLAIVKTAALLDGGARVGFTLTVTNNGGADSTGWTVNDTIQAGFTNITVSGAGTSTVTGQDVQVVGGPLAAGASATITVTVTSPNPRPATVSNTATVTGNDPDPVAANNTSSASLPFPTAPGATPAGPGAPLTGLDEESVWPLVGAGALGAMLLGGVAFQARRRHTA